MDQAPDARFSRKPGDPCCGLDVNGMEGPWPALRVQAHRIHDALEHRATAAATDGDRRIDVGYEDSVELNANQGRAP